MTFPNNSVIPASGWNKQNIYLSIYLQCCLFSRLPFSCHVTYQRDCILLPTGHPGDDPIVWLTTIKFSLKVITKRGTIRFGGGVLQDVVLQHWDIQFVLALFSLTASQDLIAILQSRSDAHPYKPDSLPSLLIITFKHLFWSFAQDTFLALMLLHSSMLPLHWRHLKAKPVGECSTLVSRY